MINKKALILFLLLVSGVAHAQVFSDYGLKLLVGQNDPVGKFEENQKAKGIYSFSPGAYADIDLPAHFVIHSEILVNGMADSLTQRKEVVNAGYTNTHISRIKSSRYYLQMPVMLGFRIPSEETNVQVNLGVYGAFLMSHSETGALITTLSGNTSVDYVDSKTYYSLNRWEWGYVFSVSGQDNRTSYEFRVTKSSVPLFSNSPLYPKYNFGYMIGLGYSFN